MKATLRVVESIAAITADDWNRCALTVSENVNPFVQHEFLSALEDSGSVGKNTGWLPRHIVLEKAGRVEGVAPCYLKSHSQGEYVFDHGWADAYQRAGGEYYPKLQIAVPFTPVTGPRLFAAAPADRIQLASAIRDLCTSNDLSSAHMTFATSEEASLLEGLDWLLREDIQFHWQNKSYATYDDFLATLASAKRKALRKERRGFSELEISFQKLTGRDITATHWDHFYEFYMDTGARKWGRPYLTRSFFSLIGERMANQILLVMAVREGRFIAGALNFLSNDTVYGRNWGCVENHPFLHFETCYYQAQDFAIENKLKTVEAGAQGEHKLSRGYVPVKTQSLHFLAHPGLRKAVANYLREERQAVAENREYLADHTPFRTERGE